MSNDFLSVLKDRVLIFDGAMGTSIHKYDLTLDDYHGYESCPEILVESRPDVIQEIHASYFAAGCDAVETDTFGGSPVVLAEFGLQDRAYELNRKAAELSKKVASDFAQDGRPRFVSGSIGPTTKLPSLGHITFKDMSEAYYQQVAGLVDGGADVLQFETGQDLLQAKAAIVAMEDYFKKIGRRVPIIIQITIEAPPLGTMLTGTDVSAAVTAMLPFDIDVLGMNCATGPQEMLDPVHFLCDNWNRAVSVLPNAGLPENVGGQTVYKLTPDELAASLNNFARKVGVNIIGGCCGTTPEHLKRVCEVVGQIEPKKRDPKPVSSVSSLYSSVPLTTDIPPLIVGERTNTNGSKKFKELLEREDWDGMVAMARDQEKEGAHVIDVCTAYVGRDENRDMTTLIRRLNTESQLPIVIDSTEYPVLEQSLQLIGGKPIVNSINLEDGVDKMMRKVALIKRYGAATVALTIDEQGMAKPAAKKLEIAKRIYDLATGAGVDPEDLIFDALTFTLSTGNEDDRRLAIETLEGIRLIKEHLPGVKTILGVSNVSFGFAPRIRHSLNSVFLHYAVEAGLDLAIVHASKIKPLYKIDEEERAYSRKLIFDERTADYDPLFQLLDFYKSKTTSVKEDEAAAAEKRTIEETLKYRIIDGNRVGLEKDLDLARETYPPLEIINKLLLDGMKVVGELFGSGKMQLPFVLQSAETMKAAVSHLEQFMEKVEGNARGTMVLATVKGDVHDIGKNLVDIILSNNGYSVVNLGIKQPIENIIQAAKEHKATCIGMSGLLVKSTVIMKENLEVLNERGVSVPIVLGGAALTRRYVEEDCRNIYNGVVVYGQDAFDDLKFMEALANDGVEGLKKVAGINGKATAAASTTTPVEVAAGVTAAATQSATNKAASSGSQRNADSPAVESENGQDAAFEAAHAAALQRVAGRLGVTSSPGVFSQERSDVRRGLEVPTPPFWGSKVLDNISPAEIFPYINETVLIKGQWRVRKGEMPEEEYQQLLNAKVRPELVRLKQQSIDENLLVPSAVYGYFPCQSQGNDLIVYKEDHVTEWVRFRFPRQDHGRRLCIADFFASVEEGRMDVLPAQVVTMGQQATAHSEALFKANKYTEYLYFHGLSVESAEAMAEVVHKRVREELGFGGEDAPEIKKMLSQGYRGSRYSFGYPACPNLEDQQQLFEILEPERINVALTEEFHIVPEQSTSALVVIHPEAKYFNISRNQAAALM